MDTLAKTHQSFSLKINKYKKNVALLIKQSLYYKYQLKQYQKVFDVMLNDGRLTREELSKYFLKKDEVSKIIEQK